MAKTTGPLFSLTASGKIGNAIVYSSWKGRHVTREWLKPANPKSGAQGDRRTILAGMGRSPKYVQTDKQYYIFAKAVTDSGQSWISHYVRFIIDKYMHTANDYLDEIAIFGNHGANQDWYDEADALGLTPYSCGYEDKLAGFGQGLMLYEVAHFACDQYLLDNSKFNAEPYKTALGDWDLAKIKLMVADFTA